MNLNKIALLADDCVNSDFPVNIHEQAIAGSKYLLPGP